MRNITEKCNEIGLVPFGDSAPITTLMAELLHIEERHYRPCLLEWLQIHQASLPQLRQWTAARGLAVEDYFVHLSSDSAADGLELWLALMAAKTPVNIVMEDTVWSLVRGGIDFTYPTYVLMAFGEALPCLPEQESDGEAETVLADMDMGVDAQSKEAQGGCPVASFCDSEVSDSPQGHRASDTDMDIEAQMHAPKVMLPQPTPSGVAKEHVCPVCTQMIFSGLQLISHMRSAHKDKKPYLCNLCGAAFNNL